MPRSTETYSTVEGAARPGWQTSGFRGRSVGPARAALAILSRTATAVRWYTRELMGDASYERYLRHLRATHPGLEAPSERQFWREKHARADATPASRCC